MPMFSPMTNPRTFRVAGVEWTVCEVTPVGAETVHPLLAGGWLCFDYGATRRRLVPRPRGWRTASDAELRVLWKRSVAVSERPYALPQRVPDDLARGVQPSESSLLSTSVANSLRW